MHTPEEEALRALVELLRRMHGAAVVLRRIHIEYDMGRLHLGLDLAGGNVLECAAEQAPEQHRARGPTELEQAILGALEEASGPLKGRTVANRCEVEYTGSFRKVLSRMKKAGMIALIVNEGYTLPPERQEPDAHGTRTG